jgi:hypothetical protein
MQLHMSISLAFHPDFDVAAVFELVVLRFHLVSVDRHRHRDAVSANVLITLVHHRIFGHRDSVEGFHRVLQRDAPQVGVLVFVQRVWVRT